MFRAFRRRFRIRPRTDAGVDAELRDEIESHLALAVEHLVARGVPREEAVTQARARFGNLDEAMPALYASARRRETSVHRREGFDALRRDLSFALRQLRQSPSFAIAVVLTLGFGIGASATVFSWMEALILRPLPTVQNVERLVTIRRYDASALTGSATTRPGDLYMSVPDYRDWVAAAHSTSGLAATSLYLFGVQIDAPGANAEPLYGIFTSANYFDVVGVRPQLGRAFVPQDDLDGTAPVVVISHQFWQTRLGLAGDVIGRRLRVSGQMATIVGVAPPGFGGTLAGVNFDLWMPLHGQPLVSAGGTLENRRFRWLDVIGRLGPGVDMRQASAEFRELALRLQEAHPEDGKTSIRVAPLDTGPAEQLRPLFLALVGLTVIAVLIVCSNVANLLLVRAAARAREMGVRLSLGATRTRLIRQLMTENVLLAALGASAGIAFTMYGRGLLAHMMPTTSVPLVINAQIDMKLLAYVVGVTCLAVLVFGLAPAVIASRVDLADVLKNGGRGSRAARSRLRYGLVVAQFALSLTALVCGALFMKRNEHLRHMDRGFTDPEHVLLIQTDMSFAGYHDLPAWQRTVDATVARLAALPGARAATAATFVPLGFIGVWHTEMEIEGHAPRTGESMRLAYAGVYDGYFDLMGVPIREGRAIVATDTPDRDLVAVVNETFAHRYWPTMSAIGHHVSFRSRTLTIVGVAKDGKYDYKRMDDPSEPLVYFAFRQLPDGWITFHVRTSVDPMTMVGSARQAIASVDPRLPIIAPTSLVQYTALPMFPSRLAIAVLSVLSTAALILAAMGLYAIIAYGVALRTREIGIRLALGGTGRQVISIFVGETVRLLAVSIVVGIGVALAASAFLHKQLVVLPMPDVVSVVAPIVMLSVVALIAGFLPARRSASIDLASTLRAE